MDFFKLKKLILILFERIKEYIIINFKKIIITIIKILFLLLLTELVIYMYNKGIILEIQIIRMQIIMLILLLYKMWWELCKWIIDKNFSNSRIIRTDEEYNKRELEIEEKKKWIKKNKYWGKIINILLWIYRRNNIFMYVIEINAIKFFFFVRWFNWKFYKYEKFRYKFWKYAYNIYILLLRINYYYYYMLGKIKEKKFIGIIITRIYGLLISVLVVTNIIKIYPYIIFIFIIIGILLFIFLDKLPNFIKKRLDYILIYDMHYLSLNNIRGEYTIIGYFFDHIFLYDERYFRLYGKFFDLKIKIFCLILNNDIKYLIKEVKYKPSFFLYYNIYHDILESLLHLLLINIEILLLVSKDNELKNKLKKLNIKNKNRWKKALKIMWSYEKYIGYKLTDIKKGYYNNIDLAIKEDIEILEKEITWGYVYHLNIDLWKIENEDIEDIKKYIKKMNKFFLYFSLGKCDNDFEYIEMELKKIMPWWDYIIYYADIGSLNKIEDGDDKLKWKYKIEEEIIDKLINEAKEWKKEWENDNKNDIKNVYKEL